MVTKSTYEKFYKTKNSYFIILYSVRKSVQCIQIFNEIVYNQNLFRNKDDF